MNISSILIEMLQTEFTIQKKTRLSISGNFMKDL